MGTYRRLTTVAGTVALPMQACAVLAPSRSAGSNDPPRRPRGPDPRARLRPRHFAREGGDTVRAVE